MHADLHPGNLLVDAPYHRDLRSMGQLDANDDGHKTATLVDAGMVARLSAQESAAFIGIIASLGEGNGKDAADCILQFSAANADRLTEAQRDAFQDDVIVLFARECRGYGTNVDVGNVLKGLLTLIRKHEIMVDANFATLVINLLCIEGLAQKAWPQYNPLDAAQPILTAYRRLTGPDGRRKPLFHLRMALNQIRKQMRDKMFFEQEKRKRMLIDELRGVVVRPPRLTM
jgi:aarF domain-containing kinase